MKIKDLEIGGLYSVPEPYFNIKNKPFLLVEIKDSCDMCILLFNNNYYYVLSKHLTPYNFNNTKTRE